MKIPHNARYEFCNQKACEFLVEHNIKSFPIDVLAIIHQHRWAVTKYSELMEIYGCDLDTVIRCIGSKDGYVQFDKVNYSIIYNDVSIRKQRTLFTLMHEIGHIYLKHLEDFEATGLNRGSLTEAEYKVLENEADIFARNVLTPAIIIQGMRDKSIRRISSLFGVSHKAAKTRINLLQEDIRNNDSIQKKQTRIYYNFLYKKSCWNCKYGFVNKQAEYCPVCGYPDLEWSEGKMIYEIKIKLSENSKALICPVCNNEQVPTDGDHCNICGTCIVNRCTKIDEYNNNLYNCGALAAGNSRYCIYCGSPTTFYKNGVLDDWEVEAGLTSKADEKSNDSVGFMEIPDEIDEELPYNTNELPFN